MSFKSPAALAVSFIHFFALWRSGVKCTPEKSRGWLRPFFFSNTHSKYVLCHDDTIHAIKFPCYDLTFCNQASTVRPFKSHLRLKTTTCESTMKKIFRSTCATDPISIFVFALRELKGIVHFEIKIWYLSVYPKGIQDVGVFFSSVDPILMFLGQTFLVCQSYNGRYRCPSL